MKASSLWNDYTINVHYWTAISMLYTVGIACVRYSKFSYLNTLFHLMLPEHSFSDSSIRIHLLSKLHLCYWDKDHLNFLLWRIAFENSQSFSSCGRHYGDREYYLRRTNQAMECY